jgi:hypothetical protein
MKGTCKLCGKKGRSREYLRLMEEAVDGLLTPLTLIAVVREKPDAPEEANAFYAEGLEMARFVHQQGHGLEWTGQETRSDFHQHANSWAARAMEVAMTYQDQRDANIFKGNPRLMEMQGVVVAAIVANG